jgi:hypothetical protein
MVLAIERQPSSRAVPGVEHSSRNHFEPSVRTYMTSDPSCQRQSMASARPVDRSCYMVSTETSLGCSLHLPTKYASASSSVVRALDAVAKPVISLSWHHW